MWIGRAQAVTCCISIFVESDKKKDQDPEIQVFTWVHMPFFFFTIFFALIISRIGYFFFFFFFLYFFPFQTRQFCKFVTQSIALQLKFRNTCMYISTGLKQHSSTKDISPLLSLQQYIHVTIKKTSLKSLKVSFTDYRKKLDVPSGQCL